MFKYIKYLNPLIIYFLAFISFTNTVILCWLFIIYSWVVIPGLELFIKPSTHNLSPAEEAHSTNGKKYDYMLYLIVFIQIPTLFFFLYSFVGSHLNSLDVIGRITAMGKLCGTFGINVAYELGHKKIDLTKRLQRFLYSAVCICIFS